MDVGLLFACCVLADVRLLSCLIFASPFCRCCTVDIYLDYAFDPLPYPPSAEPSALKMFTAVSANELCRRPKRAREQTLAKNECRRKTSRNNTICCDGAPQPPRCRVCRSAPSFARVFVRSFARHPLFCRIFFFKHENEKTETVTNPNPACRQRRGESHPRREAVGPTSRGPPQVLARRQHPVRGGRQGPARGDGDHQGAGPPRARVAAQVPAWLSDGAAVCSKFPSLNAFVANHIGLGWVDGWGMWVQNVNVPTIRLTESLRVKLLHPPLNCCFVAVKAGSLFGLWRFERPVVMYVHTAPKTRPFSPLSLKTKIRRCIPVCLSIVPHRDNSVSPHRRF